MKRLAGILIIAGSLMATLLSAVFVSVIAQSVPPSGTVVASAFAGWVVPQGSSPANGMITWPSPTVCTVTSTGYTFPAFKVGRRFTIVDANPSLTEVVTPTIVTIGTSQCTVVAAMTHTHTSYFLRTGTAGLQEAIDYQDGAGSSVVTVTPGFTAAGGTTSTITSAVGKSSVSIIDSRTSVIVPYVWSGSAYVAQPFASGGGINPGQLALAQYPTISASTVSPANFTYDAATGNNLTIPSASITGTSPYADIRAAGGTPDGATDISASITTQVNKCHAANGNSCQVLFPCAGPAGCYMANGSALPATPSAKVVELDIQGNVYAASTVYLPSNYTVKCMGGQSTGSFQSAGSPCGIIGTTGPGTGGAAPPTGNAHGTLGTAITTTGSSVTFTPTFTTGSSANFFVNSAISVSGLVTCSATASRLASTPIPTGYPSNWANTTFTLSSCTSSSGTSENPRIATGSTFTSTGCSDSSFNSTGQNITNDQDWPNSTMKAFISGGASTATGCTIIATDDANTETVRIEANTSGVMQATFAHPHAASDLWGMVGVSTSNPSIQNHLNLDGVSITGAYGMQLWIDFATNLNLHGVFAVAQPYLASGAVECDGCSWGQMNSVQFFSNIQQSCVTNCSQSSYTYGLRCSQDSTHRGGIGCGNMEIRDFSGTGIKVDGNGMANQGGAGGSGVTISLSNPIVEKSTGADVMFDNSHSFGGNATLSVDNFIPSDNGLGNTQYFVGATDCCLTTGFAKLGHIQFFNIRSQQLSNKYWINGVDISGVGGPSLPPMNTASVYPTGSSGIISNGHTIVADIRGSGANLSPSLIPYPTLPVIAAPTCATCSTVKGFDRVPNSGLEIQTGAAGANEQVAVGSTSVQTYAGDWIIYGSYWAPGTGAQSLPPGSGFGAVGVQLATTGTDDSFQGMLLTSNPSTPSTGVSASGLLMMISDGWALAENVVQVVTGDSTSHTIKLNVDSGPGGGVAGVGNRYWGWFWSLVPGPNNPSYDGITTQQDVMQAVRENYHGAVPGNWSLPGVAATTIPIGSVPPSTTLTGTSGTAVCSQGLQGTQKYTSCYLNAYAQTGTAQTYTFPAAFATTPILLESGGSCGTYNPSVSSTVLTLPANAAMTGETCNVIVLGQ